MIGYMKNITNIKWMPANKWMPLNRDNKATPEKIVNAEMNKRHSRPMMLSVWLYKALKCSKCHAT
jgi:hypothetical protein